MSLVTSVAIRKHIETNTYLPFWGHCWQAWGHLVTKKGTLWWQVFNGLSFLKLF